MQNTVFTEQKCSNEKTRFIARFPQIKHQNVKFSKKVNFHIANFFLILLNLILETRKNNKLSYECHTQRSKFGRTDN